MVYHTFTAGEVLSAANVMNDLMNQSVIVCTSGAHPASPIAGMTVYETDTGNLSVYSGSAWVPVAVVTATGAWVSYSATWTSDGVSPTIGNGSISGRFRQIAKTVFYEARITIGSTTTLGTGTVYRVSVPSTPLVPGPLGLAFANGVGGNVSGVHYYDAVNAFIYGIAPGAAALVAGEILSVAGSYEAT